MSDLEGFKAYEPGESEPKTEGLYEVLWRFNGRETIYGGTADWSKPGMWIARDTPGGAVITAFRLKEAAHA